MAIVITGFNVDEKVPGGFDPPPAHEPGELDLVASADDERVWAVRSSYGYWATGKGTEFAGPQSPSGQLTRKQAEDIAAKCAAGAIAKERGWTFDVVRHPAHPEPLTDTIVGIDRAATGSDETVITFETVRPITPPPIEPIEPLVFRFVGGPPREPTPLERFDADRPTVAILVEEYDREVCKRCRADIHVGDTYCELWRPDEDDREDECESVCMTCGVAEARRLARVRAGLEAEERFRSEGRR